MRQSAAFRGTGVALVTPFNEDDSIDWEALSNIIEYVIEGGVDYVVSLGTTGEAITLTTEECRQVLDFTIDQIKGRLPIVAGLFGSNFTQKIVGIIKGYNFTGIDAIMSSSPAYSKPGQEGIYQHYMRMAEVAPRPIIIYNVPGRTSSNILPDTILRLANANETFIAVKEASGNLPQAMEIIKKRPENFLVLCGEDPIALPMIACGGDGTISVIANPYPNTFSSMVHAAMEQQFDIANPLNESLLQIHPWLYIEGNPTGVKSAMAIKGLCKPHMRIPLVTLSEQSYLGLKSAMMETGDQS